MSSIVVVEEAGITGGSVLEVSGYERITWPDLRVPFDPSQLYRVSARIKNTVRPSQPDRNKIRVGVEGIAADGVTLVDTAGLDSPADQYFVAAEMIDLQQWDIDTWISRTGYILGQGPYVPNAVTPDGPSGLHPAVAFIQPVVWVNCIDGDGTVWIDSVSITAGGVAADSAHLSGVPAGEVVQIAEVDPDVIQNLTASGRKAYLEIAQSVPSVFGRLLALNPSDKRMYRASIYDHSPDTLMAVDLGLGTGVQKVALPGSLVRDDTLNLLPGRDVYLKDSAGAVTQMEPVDDMCCIVGRALSEGVWYFDPKPRLLSDRVPFSARIFHPLMGDAPWSIIHLGGGLLYVGCAYARIYRSGDYGATWGLTYQGTGGPAATVNAFVSRPPYLYAVIDRGSDGWSKCVRTTDAVNWTVSTISQDQFVYDLIVSPNNVLIASTGDPTAYGKIYTSTDGGTWTLRFTSSTEHDIVRLSVGSSGYKWALAGNGSAVRALRSINDTSWVVGNTYPGSLVASDMISYVEPVNGTRYTCVLCGDTGRIYGGTTTIDTLETTQSNVWWLNFIVIDGYLYAIGTEGSNVGQLWKRVVSSGGTVTWQRIMQSSRIRAWRHCLVDTGRTFFISDYDHALWRIAERYSVAL